MKILIVEDERRLSAVLKKGLEENAFAVDTAFDGEEGLYMAETFTYDAVLLDIMLPGMDGLSVLEQLRSKNIAVPVLMLTARGEIEDRIKGLNFGADDYIPKPFDFSELLARLNAVIRRHKGKSSSIIAIGDLIIDTRSHSVTRAGKNISLSAREYNLLEYLTLNSGRVISRTELIEHVYDSDFDSDSNIVDVYISYLRGKLDKDAVVPLIHTVRGVGYILKHEIGKGI